MKNYILNSEYAGVFYDTRTLVVLKFLLTWCWKQVTTSSHSTFHIRSCRLFFEFNIELAYPHLPQISGELLKYTKCKYNFEIFVLDNFFLISRNVASW